MGGLRWHRICGWPRGPAKVFRAQNEAAVKRIYIIMLPLICDAASFQGLQTFAAPLGQLSILGQQSIFGQQSIYGWPLGPAKDPVWPEATHNLLWSMATTL